MILISVMCSLKYHFLASVVGIVIVIHTNQSLALQFGIILTFWDVFITVFIHRPLNSEFFHVTVSEWCVCSWKSNFSE